MIVENEIFVVQMSAELIRVLTPLWFSFVGGTVAIAAIVTPNLSNERFNLIVGISSAAITGAAGIAQASPKKEY